MSTFDGNVALQFAAAAAVSSCVASVPAYGSRFLKKMTKKTIYFFFPIASKNMNY